jgi:hypothetical protein
MNDVTEHVTLILKRAAADPAEAMEELKGAPRTLKAYGRNESDTSGTTSSAGATVGSEQPRIGPSAVYRNAQQPTRQLTNVANVRERANLLAANYEQLPSLKGMVPLTRQSVSVRLTTGEEVNACHATAQVALAKWLRAQGYQADVTRSDVTVRFDKTSTSIEVKPEQVNGVHELLLEKHKSVFYYRTAKFDSVYLDGKNPNLYFVAKAVADFSDQVRDAVAGKPNSLGQIPIIGIGLNRPSFWLTRYARSNYTQGGPDAFGGMKTVIEADSSLRIAEVGEVEVAAIAASNPLTSAITKRSMLLVHTVPDLLNSFLPMCVDQTYDSGSVERARERLEECYGLHVSEAELPGFAVQVEKLWADRKKPKPDIRDRAPNQSIVTTMHDGAGMSTQSIRELHEYNFCGTGRFTSKLAGRARAALREKPLDEHRIRAAWAEMCCAVIFCTELGTLLPECNSTKNPLSALMSKVASVCVPSPHTVRKHVDPKDLLTTDVRNQCHPPVTENMISSKRYAPDHVIAPHDEVIVKRLGLLPGLVDAKHSSPDQVYLIGDSKNGGYAYRRMNNAPGGQEYARCIRLLCPHVLEPKGVPAAQGFEDNTVRRMAQILGCGSAADTVVAGFITDVCEAARIRTADTSAGSTLQDLMSQAWQGRNQATEITTAFRTGLEANTTIRYTEWSNTSEVDMVDRGLINRGLLPVTPSLECTKRSAYIKANYGKGEKPAWGLTVGGALENLIKAADFQKDPNLNHLAARQREFNKFISGITMRLMGLGGRSRKSLASWNVGPNWVAVRLGEPPQMKTPTRRQMFVAVYNHAADNGGPWDSELPQPAGWQRSVRENEIVLWRIFEMEPHEIESQSQRFLRDIIAKNVMTGDSASFKNTLAGNVWLLMAGIEKRMIQHISDTVGYLSRGSRRCGQLKSLVEKTMDEHGSHPIAGLALGVGVCMAGSCDTRADYMQQIMTLAKIAGTTKKSNSMMNSRSTFSDVVDHFSWAYHVTTPRLWGPGKLAEIGWEV